VFANGSGLVASSGNTEFTVLEGKRAGRVALHCDPHTIEMAVIWIGGIAALPGPDDIPLAARWRRAGGGWRELQS